MQEHGDHEQQQKAVLPPHHTSPLKPLIFAHHPHVAGGDGQHDDHDHVYSASVRSLEKASNVQLQHVPVAEHSWRGKDVDKSSAAFSIASEIIARAQKLCFEASLPVSGIRSITKFFYDNSKKLLGANLGYAYTHIPTLSKLLVTQKEAETLRFDRVIVANLTITQLNLSGTQEIVNLHALP